ncbi:MAG: hypothetical protein U1U88_000252, partial [Lawsonella clevelandensis]
MQQQHRGRCSAPVDVLQVTSPHHAPSRLFRHTNLTIDVILVFMTLAESSRRNRHPHSNIYTHQEGYRDPYVAWIVLT